jgi:hypothetical protein
LTELTPSWRWSGAAGRVKAPSLHLIGSKDDWAESDGAKIARSWGGPSQLRMVKGTGHRGLAEGKSFVNGILGADSDKRVQQATRTLASAFFIRHLTDADQLADELEDKVKGASVEPLEDPDLHSIVDAADPAATALI